MNDTILNDRQKEILKLLKDKKGLSRSEISSLFPKEDAARITVIRDLNHLIDSGFVKSKGKARATTYTLAQENPSLQYIAIDDYFASPAYERATKSTFNEGVFDNLHSLYNEEEKAEWEKSARELQKRGKELDKSIYKRELERFVIELSWKSSQIEGNTYDLLETETLIKQRIEAEGHPKEEAIMILNHKDAFDTMLEKKSSFKKLEFSDVTQLHGVLTKDMGIPTGTREQRVRITGTLYEPLHGRRQLEEMLRKIVGHINKLAYPPEKALVAACMVAYLQPFADGNKRTSRMLANAILLAHDYFPLSYRSVDVTEYRRAMILFYEQNNLYHFKRMFLEQLEFAVGNYFLL